MPSLYYPQLDLDTDSFELAGDEYHHLSRVKRIKPGQLLQINSGRGFFAEAEVLAITAQSAEMLVKQTKYHEQPKPRFALAFALLKNHHDELAVEKCSELGATDFFPLITDYTVRTEGKNTIERFRKIALAAIKQCDNPWLPQVHPASKIDRALANIEQAGYRAVLCSERERGQSLADLPSDADLCFLIGPEGGFSEAEFQLLNFLPQICISQQITRAETAAIAVSAQFQLVHLHMR